MRLIGTLTRAAAAALTCVSCAVGCSVTVTGTPRALSGRDSTAAIVAPAELDKLLVTDTAMSDLIGVPGLVTYSSYTGITGPQGEIYSETYCAETLFNTMWTAYNGTSYTGTAGRRLALPGSRSQHDMDEGVVSFPSADAATRFVTGAVMDWDRCGDHHFSSSGPPPNMTPEFYTLGFLTMSGDIATVVNTAEGGEGRVSAHAIAARSNVVIDVFVYGDAITAAQPLAVVNAIAAKMPH